MKTILLSTVALVIFLAFMWQTGFCRLYPGSQTLTGCQLQTFVYDVYDTLGQHIGWYPCHVNEVSLQYKVWGSPRLITPTIPNNPKAALNQAPESFSISAIYPNPFNSSTLIDFSLADESQLTIDIYDLLGRKIINLYNGTMAQGDHTVVWNGTNNGGEAMPSGIYFCSLQSNGRAVNQKITMLR